MGAARDIVENVGVPRFYFSNFPLGHSAGKPDDEGSQLATLMGALSLFETAVGPNTTVQSPQVWDTDESWKQDFMDVSSLDQAAIARLQAEHEKVRASKRANESADQT